MSSKKNNSTPSAAAYEAKRAERQAAEHAHAEAVAAVEQDKRDRAVVVERNANGDASPVSEGWA